MDCLRRLATECLLPIALQTFGGRNISKELKDLKASEGERPSNLSAAEDCKKDPYEGDAKSMDILVFPACSMHRKHRTKVTTMH